MKKILILITLLALLTGLLPVSASVHDPNAANLFVKTANSMSVNMREEPNSEAKVLTTIPNGKIVLVYSGFVSNQWSHVQYGMFNGYVMSKFLADRIEVYVKTANGKSVNMREEPNSEAKVITSLPYGTAMLAYSESSNDQWTQVQYGMYQGFIMNKFLTDKKPSPFVSPTPKPTPMPTATPSPEQRRSIEIMEAQKLGIVPPGMKADGITTWHDLNNLLTNVVRLKTKNPAAQRYHVYLTLEEYLASSAGAQYNMVLRGVAAAEMYGALLDIGDDKHDFNHVHDSFIADFADFQLAQQYAGHIGPYQPDDWRTMDLGGIALTVMDHADARTGESIFSLDTDHNFYPTHPLTNEDAILAAYRLYNSFTTYVGTVVVTHTRPANLRKGPSMKNAVIGKADPGTSFPVVAVEKGGWYQILLPDGKTAYISGSMVAFYQQ